MAVLALLSLRRFACALGVLFLSQRYPRLFPTLGSVVAPELSDARRIMPAHIGASLLRVFVGTLLARVRPLATPWCQPIVSGFLTHCFDFSPCSRCRFHRSLVPCFGRSRHHLQRGVLHSRTTRAGRLDHSARSQNAAASLGADRAAMLTEVLCRGPAEYVTGIRTDSASRGATDCRR